MIFRLCCGSLSSNWPPQPQIPPSLLDLPSVMARNECGNAARPPWWKPRGFSRKLSGLLLCRGFDTRAHGVRSRWVDGAAPLLHVLDDAVAVHNKGGAVGDSYILVENAVLLRGFVV